MKATWWRHLSWNTLLAEELDSVFDDGPRQRSFQRKLKRRLIFLILMYEWVEIVGFPSLLIFWLSQPGVGVSFESRKGSLALLMAPDPACYLSPAGVIECELSQTLSLRRV